MKIRTLKYHIEQGVRGLFKNGLMSLASIAIVGACIFILIISLCIAVNLDYVLEQIESNIGITLFIGTEPTEAEIAALEAELKTMDHVTDVTYLSRDAALVEAESMWGDTGMLEGLKNDNPFPRSLEINLDGIRYQSDFIKKLEQIQLDFEKEVMESPESSENGAGSGITEVSTNEVGTEESTEAVTSQDDELPVLDENGEVVETVTDEEEVLEIGAAGYEFKGIEKIRHAQEVTETLMTINTVLRVVSIVLIGIMCIIAVGIIMNTIKLTVFIRKNEIGIMKYVGATDWFIRWPFIIEGILIGLIGAIIPCIISWGSYDRLVVVFNNMALLQNIATLKSGGEIFTTIVPVALLLGAMLGAIGSVSSLRKHLNV